MFTSRFFSLGNIVASEAVNDAVSGNERFSMDVLISLMRYCLMDWGNVSEDFRKINSSAVRGDGDRILAQYETCKGKIWITTGTARNVTTVLFPEEIN